MPRPLDPPSHFPVRDLSRSPNHKDGFYWELISRESVEYQANTPIKRGTAYSTIRGAKQSVIDAHSGGLWFCEEIVPLRSSEVGGMPGHQFVIWVWSTDLAAQSQTNSVITYSSESIYHPIFARERLIRRDVYEADPTDAVFTELNALIGVTITNAGANYTYATGTVGTATVEFVCLGGALIAGIVTSEGSAITHGSALTISGDGAGAAATAVIQPSSAVLIHQEKRELPQDSNLKHEFVLLALVYETLPGPELIGQEYNEQLDIVTSFTEWISPSGEEIGTARTEVQPIDSTKDKVRTLTVPTTALAAFVQSFPGTTNLNLPDVLTGVTAVWETAGDDADYTETGDGAATGESASLSLGFNASSEVSASIVPDLQVAISQTWGQNLPVTHYFFFLAMPVTSANIITKLNTILGLSGVAPDTVLAWPTFHPAAHTVTLTGGRAQAQAKANVQQHVTLSTTTAGISYSIGSGTSLSSSLIIKTVRIPPTIHPLITIDMSGETPPVTVTKIATARALINGAINWPERDSGVIPATASVSGNVEPATLAATTGTTALPSSGVYIKDTDVEPWRYGYARVHVTLFDFADL